jgi:dTDP-4-dehydrorhamnose 3,5-epimerase
MKPFVPPSRTLIDGVATKRLAVHADERGRLMEMLRADEPIFAGFGQVYLTTAYPGVVKAWHLHRTQVDHFVCVAGMVKVVLFDEREGSATRGLVNEFFLGDHAPVLVRIPAGVLHGYKCVSEREALLINIPSVPYAADQPDEYRLDPHDPRIPYDWSRRDG